MKPWLKAGAVLVLFGMLMLLTYADIFSEQEGFYAFLEPYHAELMLFLTLLAIVTGALIYAFMDAKVERTKDQGHVSTALLLKLLEANQRKIILYLWEQHGRASQSELSRIEGLDKLKVHRALKALQGKGIVSLEHHGKVNRVTLHQDLLEVGVKREE